jgi:hypothetical protein
MINNIFLSITLFISFSLIYIQKTDMIFELSILASSILIIRIFLNSDKAFCRLGFSPELVLKCKNASKFHLITKNRQNQIIYNF